MFMGNVEVPSQAAAPIKMSMGTYEFGAHVVSNSVRGLPLCSCALL